MQTAAQIGAAPAGLTGAPQRAGAPGRLAVAVVFVAVVGLLGVMGLKLAGGGLGAALGGSRAGAPGVFTSGQLVKTAFRQAPDFTLRLFSGDTLRLANLRGRPVVVNFWASWCPPCRQEAPLLERTWREYRDRGVVFVGIDVWDSEQDARKFLKEFDLTYVNGPDPRGQISIDYGLSGIPETFFIDRQGQIGRKWIGPFTDQALRAFLDELVGAS